MSIRTVWVLLWCGVAAAQQFEAASVRPADPSAREVDFRIYPGRLRVTNVPLAQIIREAYEIRPYTAVEGGPSWLSEPGFNVEATAASEPSRAEMMALLRALLEERFQLKVRRGTHEGNVFDLVVTKGGPKLKSSAADSSHVWLERNTPPELPGVSYTIDAQKVTMARLAEELMGHVRRPVFDRTGIGGEFDFKIDYVVQEHTEEGLSLFEALQKQLGLRLQAAKGPVETLVVEHVERLKEN